MTFPVTGDNIKKLIPQREPMVMVSSLESYAENELLAGFEVPAVGTFVADGQLAESGLLEHMAQAVALHTGYSYYLRGEEAPMGYIGAMQQLQIHRLPKVGEQVLSKVLIMQEFMGVTLVEIETTLGGEIIAWARMKTVVAEENQ